VLVVEQNASIALDVSDRAYVLEVGRVAFSGASADIAKDDGIRSAYLGY
jgi:branched-chain amino acid transport system ATP-binding protein